MNKSKISKIVVLILTFTLIACVSTTVLADDAIDLSNSLTGGNSSSSENTNTNEDTNTNTNDNNISTNTNTNENTNTNSNTNTNTGANTNANKNSNSSSNTDSSTSTYEESDIPYAGPEDTILMVSAFIVLGIIGVYTFMKLSEYSNI